MLDWIALLCLTTATLVVAIMLAVGMRIPRPLFRAPYFLVCALACFCCSILGDLYRLSLSEYFAVPPLAFWRTMLVIAILATIWRGSARRTDSDRPRAARWPPIKMSLAAIACAAAGALLIRHENHRLVDDWRTLDDYGDRIAGRLGAQPLPEGEPNAAAEYVAALADGIDSEWSFVDSREFRLATDFLAGDAQPLVADDERAFAKLVDASALVHCNFDELAGLHPTPREIGYLTQLVIRKTVLEHEPAEQWRGVVVLRRLAEGLASSAHRNSSTAIAILEMRAFLLAEQVQRRDGALDAFPVDFPVNDLDYGANARATFEQWRAEFLLRTSRTWLGRNLGSNSGQDKVHPGVLACGTSRTLGVQIAVDRLLYSRDAMLRTAKIDSCAERAVELIDELMKAGPRELTMTDRKTVEQTLRDEQWLLYERQDELLADMCESWNFRLHATTYRRLTNAGLAAALYVRDIAAVPESLAELVPDYLKSIPADPADGAPLRYVTSERGGAVSSVGDDFIDDLAPVWARNSSGEDLMRDDWFHVYAPQATSEGIVVKTPAERTQ